ncbi:hypothetical protein Pla108_07290 [Botrimarina colliarenosi]|uniref:Uncharacterized protein n=1 Tax=Botrimarina colliarenosi TaxID=2528001 RepID=A0A5C6AK39_9BACT|nr:hypothetical protein [Botrimarina colliarenosi]TWT99786.1 hypothetical protein Pla108_07290 [Botrimarina colliarenosi]
MGRGLKALRRMRVLYDRLVVIQDAWNSLAIAIAIAIAIVCFGVAHEKHALE